MPRSTEPGTIYRLVRTWPTQPGVRFVAHALVRGDEGSEAVELGPVAEGAGLERQPSQHPDQLYWQIHRTRIRNRINRLRREDFINLQIDVTIPPCPPPTDARVALSPSCQETLPRLINDAFQPAFGPNFITHHQVLLFTHREASPGQGVGMWQPHLRVYRLEPSMRTPWRHEDTWFWVR